MTELSLKSDYFKQLDGLRFVAVLAIMAVHWLKISAIYKYSLIASNISVDLYFVLSGFLITRILLQHKINIAEKRYTPWQAIKNFYARRSLRIFPIYYLLIITCVLLNISPARDIYPWLLSYTTNFLRLKMNDLGPFGHLWTLAIEEQFYLVFPFFILWLPKKYLQKFLFGGVILALISRIFAVYIFQIPIAVYVFPFCCADALCIGGLLAYALVYNNNVKQILVRRRLLILSLLLFVLSCYRFLIVNDTDSIAFVFFRLSISGICIWIIGIGVCNQYTGLAKSFLENKIIMYLGKICYGIYLYHFIAPYLVGYLYQLIPVHDPFPKILVLEKAFVYFLFTVLMASLSWQFIEQPINNLKRKFV
jgi:peptidoglycan/LPS O-acetylase OafA/YrhL